ncbi:MAG: OmpA family protein [Spirochaetes bacterium]|nr:OmpA family protein [Spirochaetota bacterium]
MKKSILLIGVIIIAISFIACGEQVKSTDVGDAGNAVVSASNAQLAKYPVTGFAYKSSTIEPMNWNKWAKVAAPIVSSILDKLPDGYVMECRGHADSRGPEDPEGDKPGNLKISRDRAKAVYNALAGQGLKTNKITYRGVGSSQPLAGYATTAPQQRRVSFVIVPK